MDISHSIEIQFKNSQLKKNQHINNCVLKPQIKNNLTLSHLKEKLSTCIHKLTLNLYGAQK